MKYYQVTTATGFKIVSLIDGYLYEDFFEIGKPHKPIPSSVEVVIVDPDHRKKCLKGKAFWFGGGGIVLSDEAFSLMQSFLAEVQLIPLTTGVDRLFYLKPPRLNCLDLSHSEYLPCPVTGEPLIFTKYTLLRERCIGHPIFKIPGKNTAQVFVDEDFKSTFLNSSLLGIGFEEVKSVR